MDIAYYSVDDNGITDEIRNIMKTALEGVSSESIHELDNANEIFDLCHENLNGFSKCYGAVQWNSIDEENKIYNYTIRANSGISYVNVDDGQSATDVYVMPLQWAVDKAIAGNSLPDVPETMPFTSITSEGYTKKQNEAYAGTVANWIAPALFLAMIGVVYHASGAVAQEREFGISGLLTSMGASTMARLSSTFVSFSSVYFIGWILIGAIYSAIAFGKSNAAIMIFFHIFSGFSLVSYSIFLGNLFKSAQLSGIISSGVSVVLALMTTVQSRVSGGGPYSTGAIYALSWIFPPCNYSYFISFMAHWQKSYIAADMVKDAPDSSIKLIVIFVAAIVHIPAFFLLSLFLEKFTYKIESHGRSHSLHDLNSAEIRGLTKVYKGSGFLGKIFPWRKRATVVAVNNLNLDVGRGQIVCLLGANGSGKTTTLEMLSGIQSVTSGSVLLGPDVKIGICPQKNVLWDNISVREHVEIWAGIKGGVSKNNITSESQSLIEKCDLHQKIKTLSKNLSGGQKRKLQLAIMFVGDSNLCFIDEVSSGLDPISRRKIWDILLEHRAGHSQVLTTHFLDEADILSDRIAIVSKGELKAEGTAVELKQSLGGGTRVFVDDNGSQKIFEYSNHADLLVKLNELDAANLKYRVASAELEDAFLAVASNDHNEHSWEEVTQCAEDMAKSMNAETDKVGLLGQGWTMFRKRLTIARRNYLPELVTILVPIIVAAACRGFLTSFSVQGCSPSANTQDQDYTTLDISKIDLVAGAQSAFSLRSAGADSFAENIVSRYNSQGISDQKVLGYMHNRTTWRDTLSSFEDYISEEYASVYPGGLYIDNNQGTVAYKVNGADFGVYTGTTMLNYLDNLLLNGSHTIITNYSPFQMQFNNSLGNSLQFALYVGLAMAAAAAFASLYPTFERISKVRAMQYSNGLRVLPLWVSYLVFCIIIWLVIAAVLIGIMYGANNTLNGPGYLFLVFWLYGITASLASYVISLFAQSQLAAFAVSAAYHAVVLLIYLIAFLCELTYGSPTTIPENLLIIQFTISILGPAALMERGIFLALNMFGAMCTTNGDPITYMGDIDTYGGCILYLFWQAILLFGILIWWESGRFRLSFGGLFKRKKRNGSEVDEPLLNPMNVQELINETSRVDNEPENYSDGLRVAHATKVYGHNAVCKDVSFGVTNGECFALLGPNGAGKTTTFNMIRGEIWPTSGQIYVGGSPVTTDRSAARSKLGVCPQFDAMDKMTVVEILHFYARLRGLKNISQHVDNVITAVGVGRFRARIANDLSGGNKRKLSLGIALICNPLVLLLDEPSSGMDAFAKRIMWKTLSAVSGGRAIVLTTHSMEEADALANRAGFLARNLLAVGKTDDLRNAYGKFYHVHLVSRSAPLTGVEEMEKVVSWITELFPGAIVADRLYQGQIKMKIPVENTTVASLFELFENEAPKYGVERYSVSPTRLEEIFLEIVGDHQVQEES